MPHIIQDRPDEPSSGEDLVARSNTGRYIQLCILVLAAGAIYPLLYLRQNFETSIIDVFQISQTDLANYYSILGLVLFVSYLPSGWLADRVSARYLMTVSLSATGCLGLWFATIPNSSMLAYIFFGWGMSAGLTFWASLIKSVNLIAGPKNQGLFFGILDGGRGLVEAVLATIAVALFAYAIQVSKVSTDVALIQVIYLYAITCLVLAVITLLFLEKQQATDRAAYGNAPTRSLWQDLKLISRIPELWLVCAIIFCGYQLYWATYSFSIFLQEGYGVTAIVAGYITVAKLWMRPIGGIGAGLLGDKLGKENVLIICMLTATLCLIFMIASPGGVSTALLVFCVLLIGLVTYAIRGIYWAILDDCHVPVKVTGLSVGVISLLAYTPDMFLPQLNSLIAAYYTGDKVYQIYFGYIALMGFLGVLAAFKLKKMLILKKGLIS